MLMAAVAAACVSVPATAQEFKSAQILTSLREPALAASLKESGATWTKSKGSDGIEYYAITFANGIKATAYFTVCKPEGCMGMTLFADFDQPKKKTTAEVDKLINTFNMGHSAGKVMRGDNGAVKAQAYVVADHGIAMGNFQLQILIFASICEKLRTTLYDA